jgi:hypothetical protein
MKSKFPNLGTKMEPCYVFRNVFKEAKGERGKKMKEIMKASFKKNGKPMPKPTGKKHWKSWENGQPANGKGLIPKTKQLLAYLKKHRSGDRHVGTPPGQGFWCKSINITGADGDHGWHQDSQDYGRLLFLFVAGNTGKNILRFGGKKSKKERSFTLNSGDCLVFEGQTWHTLKKIYKMTSPWKDKHAWLYNRRMSVLVRQCAPKKAPSRPHFLKK